MPTEVEAQGKRLCLGLHRKDLGGLVTSRSIWQEERAPRPPPGRMTRAANSFRAPHRDEARLISRVTSSAR
jgi:hypothetical protein